MIAYLQRSWTFRISHQFHFYHEFNFGGNIIQCLAELTDWLG